MDIMGGEKPKKLIRLAVWLFRKKLGEGGTGAAIHEDMIHSANPALRYLTEKINEASVNITDEEYQQNTVRELGELALWILGKDTGYQDIFFWLLDQILQDADELREAIKDYVRPPDKWYVNVWSKTKKNTAMLKKSGAISKHGMSPDEHIFTPEIQSKKLERIK